MVLAAERVSEQLLGLAAGRVLAQPLEQLDRLLLERREEVEEAHHHPRAEEEVEAHFVAMEEEAELEAKEQVVVLEMLTEEERDGRGQGVPGELVLAVHDVRESKVTYAQETDPKEK